MLTTKQIKLLELLDEQILSCNECDLWTGGCCKPSYTKNSSFVAVGEAPGEEEVGKMPFIGKAGKLLWKIAEPIGFQRSDFLIVNSVNCRPIDEDGYNGKPTEEQTETCDEWVRKYIRIIRPEKIILMGTYAVKKFFPQYKSGLTKRNGTIEHLEYHGLTIKAILSVHPAYGLYNKLAGIPMLKNSLEVFKNV